VGAIKTLTETMVRTEKNFNELNNNLEFQHKQLVAQGNSINAVIDSVQLMSKWVQGNSNEKSKLKKNINKSIEDLQKWKQHLDMYKHNQLSITIQSPPPMITNNSPNNNININNKDSYSNEDILSNSHMHDD
jgi:ABC-type transporter Mla subunit MlaD